MNNESQSRPFDRPPSPFPPIHQPRRLHHAWLALGAAFVLIAITTGVRLTLGAFIPHWEPEFAASRTNLSVIATLMIFCYGLMQPAMGRLADRSGPAKAMTVAAVVTVVGLVIGAFSTSLWHLGLALGGILGIGLAGTSNVTGVVVVVRWFDDRRRGLMIALMIVSMTIGKAVLLPASLLLADSAGWRVALLIYAAITLLAAPIAWMLLRPTPESLGLLPYGTDPTSVRAGQGAQPRSPAPAMQNRGTLFELLVDRRFWLIGIPYMICGATTLGMIDVHLVPYAVELAIPAGVIAVIVLVMSIANIVGIMSSGYLSDRFARPVILAVAYGVRALAYILLASSSSPTALLIFAIIFGLVDMSTIPPVTALAAQIFGRHRAGLTVGLLSLSHQIGASLGAFAPGALHDITGSYRIAFLVGATILVVATALSATLHKQQQAEQPAAVTA